MAGVRQTVPDPGLTIAPRRKRQRLADLSRKWQKAQDRKKEAERARQAEIDAMLERAAEQYQMCSYGPRNSASTPKHLMGRVASWHGFTRDDVLGRSRSKPMVACRHDAIAAVYINCTIGDRPYTLPELGREFGLDHTSVLFALRKRGVAIKREKPGAAR